MIELASFAATIQEFLTQLKSQKKISYHTQRSYTTDLEQFKRFWHELQSNQRRLILIQEALQEYIHALDHRILEKRSIARKLSCFSSLIKFLQKKSMSITLDIKRPTFERKLPHPISPEELDALLAIHAEALPTSFPLRDKALIELLYATGVTSSELVRITLDDIDLARSAIKITGKKNTTRVVFFGTMAHERLLDYLTRERRPGLTLSEPLFLNPHNNKPLTTRSVQKICSMFKQFLPEDQPLTPHTLRHSFATHLIENGINKKDLQELLGYSAFLSTEQYAHVIPKSPDESEF